MKDDCREKGNRLFFVWGNCGYSMSDLFLRYNNESASWQVFEATCYVVVDRCSVKSQGLL
jgi:hypothetical protein